MKIAYLILAHKDPTLLKRLVERISSENSECFIHLDAKSNMIDFLQIEGAKTHFIRHRINVNFDHTILDASLILLKTALTSELSFDYFLLLSGCDYPIEPPEIIDQFFEENCGSEFLELLPFDLSKPSNPLNRLLSAEKRYQTSFPWKIFGRIINRNQNLNQHRNSCELKLFSKLGFIPFWGSAWWALSRSASECLLEYINENQGVYKYFRQVRFPEEMFIHMVLGNSAFKQSIKSNITYINWGDSTTHPDLIQQKDIDRIKNFLYTSSTEIKYLFARKFSSEDSDVLEQIDKIRLRKQIDFRSRF